MQMEDGRAVWVPAHAESSGGSCGSACCPGRPTEGGGSFVEIDHEHEVVKLQFTSKRLGGNGQILGMLKT